MPNGGPVILDFEYNADGMRTKKTSAEGTSEYYYHGTQLVHLKHTEGNTVSNLHFYYNAEGKGGKLKGKACSENDKKHASQMTGISFRENIRTV